MSPGFDSRKIHPVFYESDFACAGVVSGTNVVLFRQSAKPIPLADFDAIWSEIEASFSSIVRPAHALMLDVRKVRGRNDPEFERMFAPYRSRMSTGWRRGAIVVASAPGVLQVQRYTREDNTAIRIFEDPDAALLWLQEAF